MHFEFKSDELRDVIREVVGEIMQSVDWPINRMAVTEAEAAQACGVARHVLRDLRLAGKIRGRKLGRKVVYLRTDLIAALETINCDVVRK